MKNYPVCNCLVSGWKSRESVPKLVEEYMNKGLMVDEFVSHTMPLEEVNEAFDLMHAGKRWVLYEPRHEKTCFLHVQIQSCISCIDIVHF